MSELPDAIRGYTPAEAFEVRVKEATEKLCAFDPGAAEYRMRTEAWVRLVLGSDDERERENNPQYEPDAARLHTAEEALREIAEAIRPVLTGARYVNAGHPRSDMEIRLTNEQWRDLTRVARAYFDREEK